MDEQALIRRIRRAAKAASGVPVGIGDDAAVVHVPAGRDLVLTADMIVEGTHFTAADSTPREWGRKAAMCNLSDAAAMGADPHWALVCVGLPASTPLAKAWHIQRGIDEVCRKFGVRVVGGDTCRSERVVISVTVAGSVRRGKALTRAGAKPGHLLFVTGRLGGSLKSRRHLTFTARLAESRFLSARYPVGAMIDLSDGSAKDLRHVAAESGVGLRVFEASVPLHRGVRSWRDAFADGEDFELAFTLPAGDAARLLRDRGAVRAGFTFYPIGRVVPKSRGLRVVLRDGSEAPFPVPHDHHFAR